MNIMAKNINKADAIETSDDRTISGAWVSASLIPGEASTSYTNQNTGRDYDLVTRGITGTAWRAASINATVLSGQCLRLYRASSTTGSKTGRKIADRRQVKHATNRGRTKSLIGKAAMYAGRAGDDIEEVLDHPVLDLLQNPDPIYTGPLWLWMLFWFKEIAGRAYIYVGERGTGNVPVSAYILPSEFAWPILSDTGLIGGYYYGRNRSSPMRIPSDDVVYLRQHGSPIHPAGGMSWLFSVLAETDMEASALQAEAQRWLNGGMPGMVFKASPTTTDAQMKQINAHLNQSTRGVGKAGSVLLLRDTELIQYGTKPHEMQYVEGITCTEKRIYDAAGIPEPIYRLNSANLASATVANAQYMRYTIAPRLATLAAELTELLLPQFGVEPGEMWFCFDDPAQEDQIQLATELRSAESQGLITPNEYRAVMDLEALPDEQNLLRYRQTEAPIGGSIFGGMPATANAEDMPTEDVGEASVDVEQPTPQDEPTETSATDIAGTALNGAQVQALASLAGQVATGQLPLNSARAIAGAAFPMVPIDVLDSVFNPLRTFTPEPEPAATPAAKAMQTKADGYEPTKAMKAEAERGLEWRREYNRGGTEVGVARARDIMNGRSLSIDTVYRMRSYFARHEVDKQGQGWSPGEDGYPSAGRIAWALWGGDPGKRWADAIVQREEAADEKSACGCESANGVKMCDTKPCDTRPRVKVPKRCKDMATLWNDEAGVPENSVTVYEKFRRAMIDWQASVFGTMVNDQGNVIAPSAADMTKFESIVSDYIMQTLQAGVDLGAAKIDVSETTWTTSNETAMAYIRNRGMALAVEVPETMKATLQATIERELASGFTITQIKDQIQEVAPELAGWQAERIARTETAAAFCEGQRQLWESEGIMSKQWLVGGGQCPLCDEIVTKYPDEVPIGEAFSAGEFIGQAPPAHPNCRCDLAPGVEYIDE